MFDFLFGERRRRKALQRGWPTSARVLEVRDTRVRLSVCPEGFPPYEAETRVSRLAGIRPGAVLRCWVHPTRPTIVALET